MRPLSCINAIWLDSISLPTVAVSDWTLETEATTSMVSVTSPSVNSASTVVAILGSSFFLVCWNFLKPPASTVTV